MKKRTVLALIDSHALIHRAYHALPPMNTSSGVPTNAVYGFVAMLLKALSTLKPTHVAAAFDSKGPTFRSQDFADYKAHRKPADEALITQFALVRRVIDAFNIPLFAQPGFEADDIIGTIVEKVGPAAKKIIVTGDADALQLIDGSTSVFTLKRGVTDTILYDEAVFRERYGFAPSLLPDYKGLTGDASDNIPGVAGIGDKTARELVSKYGSIESIYTHLAQLSPRVQTKLASQKKAALFSRDLSRIKRDVPLTFDLAAAVLEDYDPTVIRAVFNELEIHSFNSRLPKSRHAPASLFKENSPRPPVSLPKAYHLVEDSKDQKKLIAELKQSSVIAVDTETEYLDARKAPLVGISLAAAQGKSIQAWYVPVDRETVRAWQELLESKNVGKVGHNLKYDIKVLRQSGITLAPIVFDSMVASYLLNPGVRVHSLDLLAMTEFNRETIPITDLIGKGRDQKKMSEVPLRALARYSCEDAELALRLYDRLAPRIREHGLQRILEEFELPLIEVLAAIELKGVGIDTMVLKKLARRLSARLLTLQQEIWQQGGEQFNINSTQQLRRILFEKLGLTTRGISRKQTGYSTAAAELTKLRDAHPIIALIEEHRELSKLLNTYLIALPKLVDTTTKRLYTSFNQTVAATGRLSSSDPNLQNIPIRTELGNEIRAAFVAERGNKLIKADYSQLELRLAAHIAHDEKMIEAFRAGVDIHRATAASVYGITPEAVSPAQRRVAKTLNFGVLYGMGPKKFARESGLTHEEAQLFVDRYRQEYRGITQLFEATIEQARTLGYVETLFGRRRSIPEINSPTMVIRAAAERMAFNFPMQGTGADILKKAMIALHELIKKEHPKTQLVLTVHDELVAEAPVKQAEDFARAMKETMEGVYTLDVPLEVEVAIGDNWKDMEPFAL